MSHVLSPTIALILIAVLAMSLRVGLAWSIQRHLDAQPGRFDLIEGDAMGYWLLAQQIHKGHPYAIYDPPRQVHRMPGFPAILAASMRFFGDDLFATRVVLAVIGTSACIMTYIFAWQLFDPLTALIAGLWTALSPPMAVFSVLILSETAFALFLLVNLSLFVCWWQAQSLRGQMMFALLTGLATALATYQRPSWYPMLGLFALGWWYRVWWDTDWWHNNWRTKSINHRAWSRAIAPTLLMLLAFALAMSPWVVRNHHVTGHWILTTLWMGPSLYDGLQPEATGESDMRFFDEENLMASMSEYDMDRNYKQRAWQYAFDHPGRAIELAFIKAYRYWKPWPNASQFGGAGQGLAVALHAVPLFLLTLIAFARGLTTHAASPLRIQLPLILIVTAAPIVYFGLIHMLFVSSLRYRLPLEYPLAATAAYAVSSLLTSLTTRHQLHQLSK